MKTTKHKLILFLILTLPILFLSSCLELSDADWELLEVAFESWAEENGLLENDQWQPDSVVEKAIENTVGNMTNKEPFVQLGALDDVIRDIDRADELANEAMIVMDKGKMEEAIELRPNDWRLREQMGVLRTSETEISQSADEFDDSTELIKEQIKDREDCVKLRIQQLDYREILLLDAINNCDSVYECNDFYLSSELEFVQESLYNLKAGKPTTFCLDY